MNFAWTSAIIGAAFGSILTFILTQAATTYREKRQLKYKILLTLMGGRARIFSQDVSDHINAIPLVFVRDGSVRKAYQNFITVPSGNSDMFFKRYIELVLATSKSLGYKSQIDDADVWHGFYPSLATGEKDKMGSDAN